MKKDFLFFFGCFIIYLFVFSNAHAQTVVRGIVRDSLTNAPLSYVTVTFEKSNIGTLSNEDGEFVMRNSSSKNTLVFSEMGYLIKRVVVPANAKTELDVKMKAEGIHLAEIVVKPQKEKYSKKNNPAVDLIKKVIEHKLDYNISTSDYYSNSEFEQIVFSINDYHHDKSLLKKVTYLANYVDTSLIDGKPILPFSVRETITDNYYRKSPQKTQSVIKAYNVEGMDQFIDKESLDGMIKENFQDISITDDNIYFMKHNFVGPLNKNISIHFYKWYIIDTIQIEQKKYIHLGFVPFNKSDIGFIGDIYVQPDAPYAVKKVSFRVPPQINLAHVQKIKYMQEFEEQPSGIWFPLNFTAAIDYSYLDIAKVYIAKQKIYSNYSFAPIADSVFSKTAPVIFASNYNKKDELFWNQQRKLNTNKDFRLRNMMRDMNANKFNSFMTKWAFNVMLTGSFSIDQDLEKNKLDVGNALTLFSYNPLERFRFRITAATTKNLLPHLFFNGYAAYGTKDEKLKYDAELTWTFNERKYHKDEFPRNNLSVSYCYDVHTIGQQFLGAERDNTILSFQSKFIDNMTYRHTFETSYIHEYYGGFLFKLFGRIHNDEAAGTLLFSNFNGNGEIQQHGSLMHNEFGMTLRYAYNEKFYQRRSVRKSLPSEGIVLTLTHTAGFKNLFGGQFNYQKSILSIEKEFWISPYGRISTFISGEKVWNSVPFPLLSMPYANMSLTLQPQTFSLVKPMEFVNDAQLAFHITYNLDGWLFNRIPLINKLKWTEVIGFKGLWGNLSSKNNPNNTNAVLLFPPNSHQLSSTPYMEFNVGIANILQCIRIDYIRRLNYLHIPNSRKDGFVIGVSFKL